MAEPTVYPISIPTCEELALKCEISPLLPSEDAHITLFPVDDPHGVRKAVVPLFLMEADGHLKGLGTAFALDPWGSFMTADHVVEELRRRGRTARESATAFRTEMLGDVGLVALVGMGLFYGNVPVPTDKILPVTGAVSPAIERDDPLAWTTAAIAPRPLDVAVFKTRRPTEGDVHNLLIRSAPPQPVPGEFVVAIGFPEIKTFSGSPEEARTTIQEQMKVAYGRVTRLHPRGRDSSNPTPVFEVEANWPSGMSGGPVLNTNGEVIGIVSRSIAPETPDGVGRGWATWLGNIPDLPQWAPMLDQINCEWRRGWGVVREDPWHLAAVFRTKEEALAHRATLGDGYVVRHAANRIGTADFLG